MLDPVRWITADGVVADRFDPDVLKSPGKLRLIDQTKLPETLEYLETDDLDVIVDAIKRLVVRGAPAIGCAAALGLAAVVRGQPLGDRNAFVEGLRFASERLAGSRPTAVNLFWALNRCAKAVERRVETDPRILGDILLEEALNVLSEDVDMCRAIGRVGVELIKPGMGVLTHCNAGALATGDYGTALSPMYAAKEGGVDFTVYADETRPLLQGARLTAWELNRAGIKTVVVCDNVAAQLMREGKVDLVIVGTDRIAANGDVANKIGTYGVAVLAKHHRVPFYVASPHSTIDMSLDDGDAIPIEQRDGDEVRLFLGRRAAPAAVDVYNPAFDVTPNELVTGIITERGLLGPPFSESIREMMSRR